MNFNLKIQLIAFCKTVLLFLKAFLLAVLVFGTIFGGIFGSAYLVANEIITLNMLFGGVAFIVLIHIFYRIYRAMLRQEMDKNNDLEQ